MSAHAALGASAAHRWMACPGSIRLEAQAPPDEGSQHAREGTAAHALLEQSLTLGLPPETWVGEDLEGWEVTEEMAEAVTVAWEYVQSRRECRPGVTMHLEVRVELELQDVDEPMFGTADVVLLFCNPEDGAVEMVEVIDYKHGRGVYVEVQDNPQLRYYLEGSIQQFAAHGASPFIATVVQPRYPSLDGKKVRNARYGKSEVEEFRAELRDRALATQDPDAPLNPDPEHQCRWCRAKGFCPAVRNKALAIAQEEFGPVPVEEFPTLSPDRVSRLLGQAKEVESWISALRAFAYQEAERGRVPPGYKLVEKRARRVWASTDEAERWAARVNEELLLPRSLVSPAQAEKMVGRGNLPEDLVELKSSGTKLVLDDHPAPALPASDFDVLDEHDPELAQILGL